jgi:hypothetical protein
VVSHVAKYQFIPFLYFTFLDSLDCKMAIQEPSLQSSDKSVDVVKDVDESYAIYAQHAEEDVSPAEAKSVLRKIDLRLIPVLWLLYLLQYLDKNGINYASVYGLQEGTNLFGNDYSWLSSIFYFGYMAGGWSRLDC